MFTQPWPKLIRLWQLSSKTYRFILQQLVGVHAEVVRRGTHGSVPALGSLREECHACTLFTPIETISVVLVNCR